MDPSIVSAGIQSGGGLLGSLFSLFGQNRSIKAQQRENALNRQFNAEQAELSRKFTREMTDAQNFYNSPSQQVNRMVDAGLNPALMYGQSPNNTSDFLNNTAQAYVDNGISPSPLDSTGIISASRALADNRLIDAQAKLAESQANKINEEIPWVSRLNSLKETLGNENLSEITERIEHSKQDREESKKRMEQINENINNLREEYYVIMERGRNIAKNNELLDKEISLFDQTALSEIAKNFGIANSSNKQAYILGLSAAGVIADNSIKESNAFTLGLTVDAIKGKIEELGLKDYLSEFEWKKVEESLAKLSRDAHGAPIDWVIAGASLTDALSGFLPGSYKFPKPSTKLK